MTTRFLVSLSTVLFTAFVSTSAFAVPMVQPTIEGSNTTPTLGTVITHLVDQSGLSASYTSGSTDFATFTATTTHTADLAADYAFLPNTGAIIDFDLGSTLLVSDIAVWNRYSFQAVKAFTLEADDDPAFGSSTALGTFNLPEEPNPTVSAHVFDFTPIQARYIRLTVTEDWGAASRTTLGEIAFGAAPIVPGLGTAGVAVLGLLLALSAFVAVRRRRPGADHAV